MMKINRLPARTWEWLRVNEVQTDDLSTGANGYSEELPAGVRRKENNTSGSLECRNYRTALGEDFDAALWDKNTTVSVYETVSGEKVCATVYQNFEVSAGSGRTDLLFFDIADESRATVIQFIDSDTSSASGKSSVVEEKIKSTGDAVDITTKYALQNKFHIGKNGSLTLIQVQNLDKGTEFYDDCGGVCEDGASFRKIQLILGGRKTYTGDFCELSGNKSSYTCDIGYRLTGDHKLDMNYVANHDGQNSESDIHVSGVMSDTSDKLFRGTIDFHRGCAGSKGSELEEVLLLDDTIVNKTVPLILCDEEDVEGSHGATIGQLDENLLFYLKSRGIKEEEIYSMMAKAKIDAVAGLIEDEAARQRIDRIIAQTGE